MCLCQSLLRPPSVRTLFLLTLLLPLPAFGQGAPMQAQQADAFVDSIGLGTDITYCGIYQNYWPQLLNQLQSLGVRHIRDGYFNSSSGPNCSGNTGYGSQWVTEHQQLAQSGIHTNYVIPYNSSTTAQNIEALSSQVQDMESIEAPNECDIPENCGGNTLSSNTQDMKNMLSFLPAVLDPAGSNLGIPVIGPSFALTTTSSQLYSGTYTNGQTESLSSEMNDNNLHVYFNGLNPGVNGPGYGGNDALNNYWPGLPFWLDQAAFDGANTPVWTTETGYVEVFPPDTQRCTVPTDIAASYVPRTLLMAFQAGVRRTYLFQFLTDPSWNQTAGDFGLISSDLTARPAFTAVQNLIANLSDKGPSFTPNPLPVSVKVTSGQFPVQQVLLQKRDGSYWLILWLEQPGWNPEAQNGCSSQNPAPAYTPVTPETVTVTLPSIQVGNNTVSSYQIPNSLVFNNTGNYTLNNYPGPSSLSLQVSDQITIVKILEQ